MMGLTPKQAKVLRCIEDSMRLRGVASSHSELATSLGLTPKCKSSVHRILVVLEDKGLIRRLKSRARSIEIIGPNSDCPHCHLPLGSAACRDAARRSRITYSRTPAHTGATG